MHELIGLPWWLSGKESVCQCRGCGFVPESGKVPWRRKWQPTHSSIVVWWATVHGVAKELDMPRPLNNNNNMNFASLDLKIAPLKKVVLKLFYVREPPWMLVEGSSRLHPQTWHRSACRSSTQYDYEGGGWWTILEKHHLREQSPQGRRQLAF